MASVLKKTTGLTGLAVCKDPHYVLGVLYKKILKCLDKMPENTTYRVNTENVVRQRFGVVQKVKDVAQLETEINGGQAEELIIQAENELMLARKMLIWKPWEPLMQEPPANQWKWPI
ncbi:hypothetical protein CHUAL_002926 [Chamberlinius hualienensis]